ncbi:signal recognition particle-docking protein FtsY [Roseospira marina]|uniref:signal recognition particle-docking protein FtsY n=1 Tax=Roseospira marina TaxID=140057 RepID=UPI0014793709|nr:signal recognition particle-docking protein FtsY [Roseospira marina]MBB4313177.1 fused signal recognition particle receptor [Roseospira marina]MBB5086082.1 fused signal recognition particle receptor [Roseospira marina]
MIWGFGRKKKQQRDEDEARQRAEEDAQAAEQARAAEEVRQREAAEAEERRRAEEDETLTRRDAARLLVEAEAQARADAQEQRRRADEARRQAEEQDRQRREAEEAARRQAEEEARRQAEEQDRQRREAEEAARRQAEEEARRQAQEQERQRREAEEADRRKAEDEARRKAEEQDRQRAAARGKGQEAEEPDEVRDPNLHAIEWGETPRKKKGSGGLFARLREGLTRSSTKISKGITDHMVTARLDDEALEYLEDVLIQSDLGVSTASDLIQSLSHARFGANPTEQEVREHFAGELAKLIEPVAHPLQIRKNPKPHIVLVVGVNGSGKTTTIGKIARQLVDWNIKVSLAAGDTFRAAAVEQLKIWGDRTGAPVVARQTGADAAGLAFDAIQEARTRGDDVLLIDTAGRLQNRTELMEELKKIVRVIKKLDETAPHTVLLVIDATVGQNALQQVKVFQEMVGVTGLAVTKLDGTAKGGVVISLAQEFALPIHFVGIGEAVEDLRPFRADEFASSLMGL